MHALRSRPPGSSMSTSGLRRAGQLRSLLKPLLQGVGSAGRDLPRKAGIFSSEREGELRPPSISNRARPFSKSLFHNGAHFLLVRKVRSSRPAKDTRASTHPIQGTYSSTANVRRDDFPITQGNGLVDQVCKLCSTFIPSVAKGCGCGFTASPCKRSFTL